MDKHLKGDAFINRYRFEGKLTTSSPLHIGSGVETANVYSDDEKEKLQDEIGKVPQVSTVIKDVSGKPLIPGSSIRGPIRHWLRNILMGISNDLAIDRDYRDERLLELDQDGQIKEIKENFSWWELLLGSPLHAGKIELWDATCLTEVVDPQPVLLHWRADSLTYIDTSVAIDPLTGTAMDKLLYKYEVVPPGVEFQFNLAGQNLTDLEIGIILLALNGFNSKIYPIHLGAMKGRGFGRMKFTPGAIYCLKTENTEKWINEVVAGYNHPSGEYIEGNSGYFSLPQLSEAEKERLIQQAKQSIISFKGGDHV